VDNTEELTVLSLCSGYGGLELGLSLALENPLRVVAVEIEAYGLANLVAKAEEGKLAIEALWPDLKTFPAERFRGCFDFVLAGYPCQPFSHAGKRKGTEDPRHLWPHIERIIEAVRPVWGFFENVPGHLTLGFPEVYCSLRDMGYSVEAGLFTAAEVGAPHKRQRLFILAHASGGSGSGREQEKRKRNRLNISPVHRTRQWPARPGEPQYEWEEPRVVEYASEHNGRTAKRRIHAAPKRESGTERPTDAVQGKTQPSMGSAANGAGSGLDPIANRVDRLRLCGNGVVPAQARKAFEVLYGLQIQTAESSGAED
jgi:DNA (cytosine-5)-methyltransferase 1